MIRSCIALLSSRARIARGIAPAVGLETELQCELAAYRLSSRCRNLGGKHYLYLAKSSAHYEPTAFSVALEVPRNMGPGGRRL
jgi:hypothetical protein